MWTAKDKARAKEIVSRLTPRQAEYLALLADGYTTESIAAQLDISLKTAYTHRGNLIERTGLSREADLTKLAILAGLSELKL